jgi:FKBP-type peptidyl-prolyl cis-trans isomerase
MFDQGVIPVVPGRRVGGRVIPGFEQALIGMRVGGKRRALIPSFLAYGAAGSPPRIPPNADLIFDIEVLSVAD